MRSLVSSVSDFGWLCPSGWTDRHLRSFVACMQCSPESSLVPGPIEKLSALGIRLRIERYVFVLQFQYYSYTYSFEMPAAIRHRVDNWMNCEDIALSLLVAHTIHKSPILVRVYILPYDNNTDFQH